MENNKMKRLIINTLTALFFIAAIFTLSSCGNSGTKKVTTQETKADTTKKEEGIADRKSTRLNSSHSS